MLIVLLQPSTMTYATIHVYSTHIDLATLVWSHITQSGHFDHMGRIKKVDQLLFLSCTYMPEIFFQRFKANHLSAAYNKDDSKCLPIISNEVSIISQDTRLVIHIQTCSTLIWSHITQSGHFDHMGRIVNNELSAVLSCTYMSETSSLIGNNLSNNVRVDPPIFLSLPSIYMHTALFSVRSPVPMREGKQRAHMSLHNCPGA